MDLADRFAAAADHALATAAGLPDSTPSVLSAVCVAVLPVESAGITMTQDPPLPLGWSDPLAAVMEQLQATLADGPCVAAATSDRPLIFDEAAVAARWPLYYAEMRTQTPFRSAASLPLALPGQHHFGALDLFSIEPDAASLAFACETGPRIAARVVELVYASIYGRIAEHVFPEWLINDAALHRADVWLSIGLLCEEEGLDDAAALSALRSYAYLNGVGLDEVADDVAGRRLMPGEVLDRS